MKTNINNEGDKMNRFLNIVISLVVIGIVIETLLNSFVIGCIVAVLVVFGGFVLINKETTFNK